MNQPPTGDMPLSEYRAQPHAPPQMPQPEAHHEPQQSWDEGRVLAVIGKAGSGTSTTAVAAAQGFAERFGTSAVVLADLNLRGDQALLHDTPDVVPGLEDLISTPNQPPDFARACAYEFAPRGYDLLLGLRRRRDWSTLTVAGVTSTIEALRRAYRVVVCDLDDDLEGQAEGGSAQVEARNCAARHVASVADAVLVTGSATLTGLRSMLLTLDDLRRLGVEANRLRPLLTRVPSRRHRRQHSAALAALGSSGSDLAGAAQSMESPQTEDAHRNGTRLPRAVVEPATAAVADLLGEAQLSHAARVEDAPRGPHAFHRVPAEAKR